MAVPQGGREPLPLKVAPIQPSVTAASHLQSRRDSDCQIWELLLSKTTSQLSFKFSDSLWICLIEVGFILPHFNTPILKTWGSASRAQRPLTTGIVRWQFPSLRGTTWRNNGRSAWNSSRFEHICAFYVEITNIHGVKLKMSCHNRDSDRSVGVCCPNALGLVWTVRQIWLPVSHAPSCIGTTNPSRTGLNPLN